MNLSKLFRDYLRAEVIILKGYGLNVGVSNGNVLVVIPMRRLKLGQLYYEEP